MKISKRKYKKIMEEFNSIGEADVRLDCPEKDSNKNYSILFPKYSNTPQELLEFWSKAPVTDEQLVRFFNYCDGKTQIKINSELVKFTNEWKAMNNSYNKANSVRIEDTEEYKNFLDKTLNTFNIPYYSDCKQLLKIYGMFFNLQQLRFSEEEVEYMNNLKFALEGWGSLLTIGEILERYSINVDDFFTIMSKEHGELSALKNQVDAISQNIYESNSKLTNIENYTYKTNAQFADHIYNKSVGHY